MDRVFGKYLLLQLPGWLMVVLVTLALRRWAELPLSVALLLLAAWVLKDLLLYPAMRRFYVSDPPEQRILRERGTAVTPLTPEGFVRIHGELWQARSDRPVEKGARIRVREVKGLFLVVTPE